MEGTYGSIQDQPPLMRHQIGKSGGGVNSIALSSVLPGATQLLACSCVYFDVWEAHRPSTTAISSVS